MHIMMPLPFIRLSAAGGYYSSQVSEKLRLVGLNTNLYYNQDLLTKDLSDPANQLVFLQKELDEARKHGQMVGGNCAGCRYHKNPSLIICIVFCSTNTKLKC